MSNQYAQVILDITHASLDHTFTYRIPEGMQLDVGSMVIVPFGASNRELSAYVIGLTNTCSYDESKVKSILSKDSSAFNAQGQLVELAAWMHRQYGATMIQALKTVMPVKKKVAQPKKRVISTDLTNEELLDILESCKHKKQHARVRLLEALVTDIEIPYEVACDKLHLTMASMRPMVEKGWITISEERVYRNPLKIAQTLTVPRIALNEWQEEIYSKIVTAYDQQDFTPCLIHGVTGSGKTEIYMELIAHVVDYGRQAIVLIPEIALTYQTVMRFYKRFGKQVSFINSRLSPGERYDQFLKAKEGKINIMIGPRSALFTPFANLGLIIIDEEHEGAYKSEITPRYHAKEVAIKRASQNNALVVLGSATPSIDTYYQTQIGNFKLFPLKHRAKKDSVLPSVEVVDMRNELTSGNRTMFSRSLHEKILKRLEKKEQIILFLNRRGYNHFISCRSCGEAIKCPHCDVTLTVHQDKKLHCHYCGHSEPMPKLCPSCGSPYIAGFGSGTEKVEEQLYKVFPGIKVLRMDMDTTTGKEGHEKIIRAFANKEADVLLGTQMVVKGHDFSNVTLVGALAADVSLFSSDYKAAERTFQLLTQAAGRAGRDYLPGEMVIQTYAPENYSIDTASRQDYEEFYEKEVIYRKMMGYPPVLSMVMIQLSSENHKSLEEVSQKVANKVKELMVTGLWVLGPSEPPIARIKDVFYKRIYLKHQDKEVLTEQIYKIDEYLKRIPEGRKIFVQYDYL
ncbi:Helicase PriA essential for oriC/DnaA-independent DNA replication [Lachnospiraceae bacterium TWA4]|nr:Helicase PriA essential for oriC/DnaA-independent DNA replication [Lachnospiraceae bacterium TWA4]